MGSVAIVLIVSIVVLSIAFKLAGFIIGLGIQIISFLLTVYKAFFIPICIIAVVATAILKSPGSAFGVFIFLLLMLCVASAIKD